MWKYLPDARRHEYAENDAEARQWVEDTVAGRQGKSRRPPELSTRDNVARAIYTEVKEGRGSPHGGAFLDISYLPADRVIRKLPSMYHQFMELADVDITKTPMEVGPTTHYMMGGLRVDPDTAAATVPGLFAAGEAAAGMHGANRLGGNSLSDLLVFGKRAGEAAAAAVRTEVPRPDEAEIQDAIAALTSPLDRPEGENPYKLMAEIQDVMTAHAPIVRDADGLLTGLGKIEDLRARATKCGTGGSTTRAFNPGWQTAYDLRSMLINAEALLRSALERKESRGAHARSDFPKLDEALGGVNFITFRSAGGMRVRAEAIPPMPAHLAQAVQHAFARYTPEERE